MSSCLPVCFSPRILAAIQITGLAIALSACTTPELYSSNTWKLNYDAPQTAASIHVTDPQMYQRHALINERRDEEKYLIELLEDSRIVTFKPQFTRDIETVRSLSLALGLNFDSGAKRANQFADEKSDLNQQIELEKLQGQLLQTQRDLELLKLKLAEQTAVSAATGTAAPVPPPSTGTPTAPPVNDTAAMITRLEASITNLIARFDKDHAKVREVSNADFPRELFQDRQAYRRDLQSAINSNSLDSLHDIGPNSLFRMQFRATVLPGEANDSLGVLQMEVERPRFLRDQVQSGLQPLYFKWLDHVTDRLNTVARGDVLLSDAALLQLGNEERIFSIVSFSFPARTKVGEKPPVASLQTDLPNSGLTPPAQQSLVARTQRLDSFEINMKRSASQLQNVIKLWSPEQEKSTTSTTPKDSISSPPSGDSSAPVARFCKFGIETNEGLNCDRISVAFPAAFRIETARRLDEIKLSEEEAEVLSARARGFARKRDGNLTEAELASCVDFKGEARNYLDYYNAQYNLLRLQRAYTWVAGTFGGNNAKIESEASAKVRGITKKMQAAQGVADAYNDSVCLQQVRITPGDVVPIAFIEALFTDEPASEAVHESGARAGSLATPVSLGRSGRPAVPRSWVARGRLSTYAVSPVALAQQVSTAARAADALQMAAALAASLPTKGLGASASMGYMRSVTGKADTVERVPLVVGFSSAGLVSTDGVPTDQARFGWLLGPNIVLDTQQKALRLEHTLAPYELTVDLSIPGWWPYVTFITNSAWSPNWREERHQVMLKTPGNKEKRSKVPMRPTKSDLDRLSTLLMEGDPLAAGSTNVGLKISGSPILDMQPHQVSDCVATTTLLVTGPSLWRASTAYLSGVKATNLEVLPDMAGVSLTFNIASLQPGTGSAMLVILTSEGSAMREVPIIGNRLKGTNCTVDGPDDGSPKITAAYPAVVQACATNQRIVLKGSNLTDIESVYLGSIKLTIDNPKEPNPKVLEVKIDQKIGDHGGSKTTLPLIVKTFTKGIAVTEIGIERGTCSRGFSKPLSLLDGPSGHIDVCGADVSLMVLGGRAHLIDSAQLVSTTPAFDLSARFVKFSPSSKITEINFVGIPKTKISGPDQLVSPFKLSLRSKNKEVTVLDVPVVCGTYK